MRRTFNKKLLPKEAPQKNTIYKQRKKHARTCAMLAELLKDYRAQCSSRYNLDDFAVYVGVHRVTARRYFYGYIPHKHYWWPISRYFAQYLNCTAELIHDDISSTVKEHRLL